MSTLSEYTGNVNPTESSRQPKETKAQIDGILQQFDVLPSSFDRFLFKYIYVYLLGLFFLAELLNIIYILAVHPQVVGVLLPDGGVRVLRMLAIMVVIWRFNVWRVHTPKTLRDLWENKRIAVPDGDADRSYLRFLAHYRDALASPKRYFLCGLLMIVIGIPFAFEIVQTFSSERPNILITILLISVRESKVW